MGASVNATIHSNITYIKKVRRYIYETRRPRHPHSPILWNKPLPQGPTAAALLHRLFLKYLNTIEFESIQESCLYICMEQEQKIMQVICLILMKF